MGSKGDWIASLVQRCSSFYLEGRGDADLELEDDGSNLRFTNPGIPRSAVIYQVRNLQPREKPIILIIFASCQYLSPRERHVQTLNLTDEKTQIEAILSSDSLDAYNRESPDRPLESYNPTRYRIILEAYEIVFEYSMSQPKVHLFIKQFSIKWDRGKVTGFGAGRQLKRTGCIKTQLNMVFGRVRQAQRRPGTADSALSSEGSLKSQNGNDSRQQSSEEDDTETGISQEVFTSQVPSGHRLAASNRVSNVDSRPSAVSTHLLSNLWRPSITEDVAMNNALTVPGPPEDAKLGSKDMPWLRLTGREITELRGKLEKTAGCNPSEDLINHELALHGRELEACKTAKARVEAEGAEFVDCDGIENNSNARELDANNRNKGYNEANKLEKPNLTREHRLDDVARKQSMQRSASAKDHQKELQHASSTKKPAGQPSKNYFDGQDTDPRKNSSQSASIGEEQSRDNHPGSTETKSDLKPASNRISTSTPREVEFPTSRVVEDRSAETHEGPRENKSNAESELTVTRFEKSINESVGIGGAGSCRAENALNEPDAKGSDGQSNIDRQDPWYGLKRLRSRDVKVPRDQHKLLEDHRQWMPALPGKSDPRGHVPPDLLAQWNRIVLLRNHRANEGEQRSKSPRPEVPDIRDSPPGEPDSAPEMDSDGGTPLSGWSQSTNRSRSCSELPADRQLPADSPVSERRKSKKSNSPRPGDNVRAEDKIPEDTDTDVHANNEQDRHTIYERPEAHQAPTQNSKQVDNELVNASVPEPTPVYLTQNREDDPDNESDESAMDAAVPCPLGNCSQAELLAEQTDHEPTSSSQSLPQRNRHEHIQIVDTPAAKLTHRVSERLAKENAANVQQESSQAATSSSQSRIFNTYASHAPSMRSPSQDPHLSSQTNGDNEIDIMGTQVTGENWPMQSTSNSHSGFVPNSSGPECRESVDIETQTEKNSKLWTEARTSLDNDRQATKNWAELQKLIGSDALEILQTEDRSYPYTVQLRKLFKDDVNEGIRKLTQAAVTRIRNVQSGVPTFPGIQSEDAWEAEKMPGEGILDSQLQKLGLMRGPGGLPVRKQDVEENGQNINAGVGDDEDRNGRNAVDGGVREHDRELQPTEPDEQKVPLTAMFPLDDGNLGATVPSSTWDSSMGGTMEDVEAPNLKRLASVFETEEASSSKRQRTEPIGAQDAERNRSRQKKRPTSNIMSRRESYINSTASRAEAMRAYEKFRSDYPIYSGEFSHFIELCSMLQSLRDRGHLKRSFLWDDFIIMHLDQYPTYLQLCQEMDAKYFDYEEYFSTHFSKPTYKKRSLNANGIEVSAAHWMATSQPSAAASPSISRGETNGTLTTSFVNRLSTFHVHSSFGPATQDNQTDIESDHLSTTASFPPTPLNEPQRNGPTFAQHLIVDEPRLSRQPSRQPSCQPSRQPSRQPSIDKADNQEAANVSEPRAPEPTVNEPVTEETMDYDSALDERDAGRQLLMENAQALSAEQTTADVVMTEGDTVEEPAADNPSERKSTPESSRPVVTREIKAEPIIPESDNEDQGHDELEQEVYDEMEETHSTASIELGDEGPSKISQEPRSDAREPETSSKVDNINEGWFASLRHLHPPTGPVWSDDPNTPFKLWARADQNVKAEVSRRGGRYRDVDNKGVIQRSTTLRSNS